MLENECTRSADANHSHNKIFFLNVIFYLLCVRKNFHQAKEVPKETAGKKAFHFSTSSLPSEKKNLFVQLGKSKQWLPFPGLSCIKNLSILRQSILRASPSPKKNFFAPKGWGGTGSVDRPPPFERTNTQKPPDNPATTTDAFFPKKSLFSRP